jgi:hypothetical protein
MIQELTPQILMISLAVIIVTATILTWLASAGLLWTYRRAVIRRLDTYGGFEDPGDVINPGPAKKMHPPGEANDLCHRVTRTPWRDAGLFGLAVLAGALIYAAAARYVYPFDLGLPGFFVGVSIYMWPAIIALPLIVPGSAWRLVAWAAAYFLVFALLGLWAASIVNIPELKSGAFTIPGRSSVTPFTMTRLWATVNIGPTLLIFLCFNRWARAVAPLVLVFVTVLISGLWFAWIALSSPAGMQFLVGLQAVTNVHSIWIWLGVGIVYLVGLAVGGWILSRWIGRAYRHQKLSDRSLILDALWWVFACNYSMWLIIDGLAWAATAPVAFVAYKSVLTVGYKLLHTDSNLGLGLTFLRVFNLGRRSDALFDVVAKYWRHIGSVQMITGPDMARSMVQPHQFLDFLSGKLSSHFVRDQRTLEHSLQERDRGPDPDGRFRINSLFCHADSWRPALPYLVQQGDTVLMDLRSFSAENFGCIHELEYLAQHVEIDRCVFVVDATTNAPFLNQKLKEIWEQLRSGSPNYAHPVDDAMFYHLRSGLGEIQQLVRRCITNTEARTSD